MANVKPTRSELITLKKKIKLAKSGHSLLKKKRDGLMVEVYEILKQIKNLRKELADEFGQAQRKINIARAVDSDMKVKSVALAIKQRPAVEVEVKNIMGVHVPKVKGEQVEKPLLERGYGFRSSTIKIDEAALGYEKVVDHVIKMAEVEVALRKLLEELKKTKRKVNALEQVTIPRMETDATYIRVRLEEMERENFARLKHIKQGLV